MIAKLQSIQHLLSALSYCERGGQVLDANLCLGTSHEVYAQMQQNNALNDRCSKQSFHIKIRIAPEDIGRLTTQDWIDISKQYAVKIGFHENPYIVYIHEEHTTKQHIHIVASRIKPDHTAVDNAFTNYKNMDFCRDMENKYQLRKVERVLEKYKKKEKFVSNDKRINSMKDKIELSIRKSNTTEEAISYLKSLGIKVNKGRGISFIDTDGVRLKGSQIDRKYSLKGFIELTSRSTENYKGRSI